MDDKSVFHHEITNILICGGNENKNRGSGLNLLCSEGCDDFPDMTIKDNHLDNIGGGMADDLKQNNSPPPPICPLNSC